MKCPNCGYEIAVQPPRAKGTGKRTGLAQSRLSGSQMWTLNVLRDMKAHDVESAVPRQQIFEHMRDQCIKGGYRILSTHIVGFWLSALLGAGFVSMVNRKCEMKDFHTQDIRFKKKPVWYLSTNYQEGHIGFAESSGEIVHVKELTI